MLSKGHLRWQVLQCRQLEGFAGLTSSWSFTVLKSVDHDPKQRRRREGAGMELSIEERKVLSKVVRTLRTRLRAEEVILYGSAARGDLDDESDIDLLVVLPKLDWETQKEIVAVCFDAELQCGRVISAICYTTDEIELSPLRSSPLVMTARREGQALHE